MLKTEVEWCPYCDTEIEIEWDVEKDGYQIICPNCKEKLMLCDACIHSDDNEYMRCYGSNKYHCFRMDGKETEEREKAKLEMKVALEHLRNAWLECNNAFSNIFIDCNDYIIGYNENDNRYPFHLSFDEMNVVEWIDGVLKRLSK